MEVQLAVYDLSRGMARSMSQAILGQRIDGIWHTGIVAYGNEYYFGGGIQVMPWGAFAAMNSMQPVEVRSLGRTNKTQRELEDYLRTISHQFTQATYDLINHNCNNFSETVSKFLLGHGIPSHIVDLPRIVFSTPGGAMLRPMLESMQGNIRQQQGHGLDPFGGRQASLESTLSDSMVSLVSNQVAVTADQPKAPKAAKKVDLEENAWVSTDAGAVKAMGTKLLNLAEPNDALGSALSDEEKERLNNIILNIHRTDNSSYSIDDYVLLEKLLAKHPEAHMAVLFIIRLMFLHDRMTDFKELQIIRQIMKRLLAKEGQEAVSGESKVSGFATVPAHVMALCAISNLLSHEGGLALLSPGAAEGHQADGAATLPFDLGNDIVDTILAGLNHGRTEVRQMSGTLAYNLTLACTKDNVLSGAWKPAGDEANVELNGQALQLLCGCLEGIISEEDPLVRKRRLATSCRIMRAFGKAASDLTKDLGLDESLRSLRRQSLSAEDAALVDEMLSYMV